MSDGGADRGISLLFDVFVVNQRLRALLGRALSGSVLRADEYAVYSVLFERGPLTPTQLAASLAMPVMRPHSHRVPVGGRRCVV
jgi:hypothetical protein